MSNKSIKDSMTGSGYDPEEAYFFEDNRRKILELRMRQGMTEAEAREVDERRSGVPPTLDEMNSYKKAA